MWIFLVILVLFAIGAGPVGADGAAVARGLLLGLVVGLATSWGWVYSAGGNSRVEAEKDGAIGKAEERAEQARR